MTAISETATLQRRQGRPLRFITCGNVDDGKSTLIGRLLWDTNSVKSDLGGEPVASPVLLPNGESHPDFALLLDGLQAERDQGITIDVAYRYFSTSRRSFIVADTPGHEQYTRNMITGASTAELAVLLVDAQYGLTEQTRRHALIAARLGIGELVLVINKMDLVGYSRTVFREIEGAFGALSQWLGVTRFEAVPTAAVHGHNVVHRERDKMGWYGGRTLLETLEQALPEPARSSAFRLSVQRVARPHEGFRGFQGTVVGGHVSPGQQIVVMPSGQKATVTSIVGFDGELRRAFDGDAVTLVLDRKIDIARGDLIAAADAHPLVGHRFTADIMVLADRALLPGRRYWLKTQARRQRAQIAPIEAINLNTGGWEETDGFAVNAMVRAVITSDEPAVFDAYADGRNTGSFILIDPDTLETVAGGMISGPATSENVAHDVAAAKTLTLSMPADLARQVLRLDQIAPRLDEIEVHATRWPEGLHGHH